MISNPNDPLAAPITVGSIDPTEVHRARVSIAEAAIAGGWEPELGGVLDMLGLRGEG